MTRREVKRSEEKRRGEKRREEGLFYIREIDWKIRPERNKK